MAFSLGDAILNLKANVTGLNKGLGDAQKAVTSSVGNIQATMNGLGKKMAVVGVGVVGVMAKFAKSAMDATESENLFAVSLGNMADQARAWSEEFGKALGLNRYEVRKNLGMMDAMIKSMGLNEQAAYDMAKGITSLSYDMASFFNLSPEEAFEKLRSGISGEAEPLKQLGILVNDTAVKAYALANGIGTVTGGMEENARKIRLANAEYNQQVAALGKSKKSAQEKAIALEKLNIKYQATIDKLGAQKVELSETDKIMARYGLIMERTTLAQGDLARTMDSPTNQLRKFRAQAEEMSIELGMALLPGLKAILGEVDKLVPKIKAWVEQNSALVPKIAAIGVALAVGSPVLIGLSSLLGIIIKTTTATAALVKWTYAKIAADKLMGSQAVATAAQQTAAGAATSGLAGKIGVLAGKLGLIAGAAGIGWAFGRWIDNLTANTAFGKWIDSMSDKLAGMIEKLKQFIGLSPAEAKIGSRTQELIDQGKLDPNKFAVGTNRAPRGLALVGEKGPELVAMGGGERVFTADRTESLLRALAGQGGVTVNLQVNNRNVTEADAARIGAMIERRQRRLRLA